MPEPRHWYIVMYDITDPKDLRRTYRLLRSWGKPVQYSVFRVRATGREIAQLRFEIGRIIDVDDRLTIVRLCESCASRMVTTGRLLDDSGREVPHCFIV